MKQRATALYARVSLADGSQTTENQFRALRELAQRAGWDPVLEFFDEQTGADESRPKYQAMLLAARQRKLSRVVVWKYDRFARSTHQLVAQLEEFDGLGIEFVSITEQIDTGTAIGKFLFTLVAGFAEFERSLISERTLAGMARVKASGKHVGRPKRFFDMATALACHADGWGWQAIADEVSKGHDKPYSRQTVRRRIQERLKQWK